MDNPISVIEEDSCWGYLAAREVGRLATTLDNQPEIFPINYCLDGESVVFRSAPGSKLEEITGNHLVAFEVDDWDNNGGWSVIVKGTAELITDEAELARADKMPLRPWIPTAKKTFVRIIGEQISGRRFEFGPEPTA